MDMIDGDFIYDRDAVIEKAAAYLMCRAEF